ncbi:F-box/LRR-repeat protein 12-like isoform X2 [Tripterygium wilfordii]|uniref:F-box/LRR-repeat protein 12-like isoform X2 n=1 Tax=Tripterygium wilfordii TaxID=458696 RepID=UPI0018F81EAF|nr:F-box/LRR-repeat protein 12-like isoform X2 [Tripterygium wilfordii]XP_038703645.1 F-box/LRR-repeat protein 12-like isoform X2 [Tripterygium wilfordii]
MSQADVSYSCGSCGYPLNLTSSNRITSAIGSEYRKSIKKVVAGYRSLEVICIHRCIVTEVALEVLAASSCFAMKLVNLSHSARLSDNGLRALSQACYKLLAVEASI